MLPTRASPTRAAPCGWGCRARPRPRDGPRSAAGLRFHDSDAISCAATWRLNARRLQRAQGRGSSGGWALLLAAALMLAPSTDEKHDKDGIAPETLGGTINGRNEVGVDRLHQM